MWEFAGGDPLLKLVRGVDEPDPEEDLEQQSQLLLSLGILEAMVRNVRAVSVDRCVSVQRRV